MIDFSAIDKIQFLSLFFSFFIFFFIFALVKDRSIKEEYSLLWFALSLFLIYFSIDRHAIDRLAKLLGVAYPPSLLTLMITGFTFLLLIHITLIISRLSEQNKEMIQELGLVRLGTAPKKAELLIIVPAYNEAQAIGRVIEDLRGIDLEMDILVVNDGSADSTSAQAKATGQALVVDLPKNLGIGGAVQTGFKYADRNGYRIGHPVRWRWPTPCRRDPETVVQNEAGWRQHGDRLTLSGETYRIPFNICQALGNSLI